METRLLQLSQTDFFTVRDACQGVSIFGGIGSGKTSGSGKALATAYLRAGMGGVVLCAKPEEAALWYGYAHAAGRSHSLLEFNANQGSFNFIAYELARQGARGLNSVVECLLRVIEASRLASASSQKGGDVFWEDTTRQLLRHTIPLLYAAYGTVSIPDICTFVRSAPRKPEDLADPAWQRTSFMYETFMRAASLEGANGAIFKHYWRDEFAALDPRTRSNITVSLTTSLDRFNHGWLKDAFCGNSTIVPELCFHGAIILLNMPTLTLNDDGIIAQQLFKYMWQRAVLSRNALAPEQRERPVFLWADEAHHFINSYDAEFQSTCRGSRACTVFLSQSLPTYFAKMDGERGRDRAHQLLGNFATKIFHSNACPETNEWAARTLGRMLHRRANYGENQGQSSSYGMNSGENVGRGSNSSHGVNGSMGGSSSSSSYGGSSSSGQSWGENRGGGQTSGTSHGYSEQMDYIIEPAQFGRMLMTGGPPNGNRVSAVWYQAGRVFEDSKRNLLLAVFPQ